MLTDGRVLSHGSALNRWVVLTPDKTGDYAKGTWSNVAGQRARARRRAAAHAQGRPFLPGRRRVHRWPGLYDGALPHDGDLRPGRQHLDRGRDRTASTSVTPAARRWATAASSTARATAARSRSTMRRPTPGRWARRCRSDTGDENAWATLQNGNVLAVGFAGAGAAIYNPTTNKWMRTGAVPAGFNTGDTGGITQMFDGRVFVYGLQKNSYIYTPGPTAADPGTWVKGPTMLDNEAEDEFSDILPNGMVHGRAGQRHVRSGHGPAAVQSQRPTPCRRSRRRRIAATPSRSATSTCRTARSW